MNNNPIGILDSGVGGLSVWKQVRTILPGESVIYVADTINCPYGLLSSEEIYSHAALMVEFLLAREVKLIVIACNTITVTCLDRLRETFADIPMVGTVPVIKTAAEVTRNKKIGVFSTVRTAESEYQQNLIKRFAHGLTVVNHGTNMIVPLIEQGDISSTQFYEVLTHDLKPFTDAGIDTLALGCTHYPFIESQIKEIMGDVMLLDSGAAVARQAQRILADNNALSRAALGLYEIFITGDKDSFTHCTQAILGKPLEADHISLEAY